MKVRFKKLHSEARAPFRAVEGAAGWDLFATRERLHSGSGGEYTEYGTGLAVEIPPGYVGLLFARSSVTKTNSYLGNGVGVLDEGYVGEILFRYKGSAYPYNVGERVGQLVIVPCPEIEFEEANELGYSVRGTGGFGSSGT